MLKRINHFYPKIIYSLCFLILFFVNISLSFGQNNKKPIKLKGSLSAGLQYYNANGIENRWNPFVYRIVGTPIIEAMGIRLPFTIAFTNQQTVFRQPFNKFGVSPEYKWAKFHLGWSRIHFSDYTLSGRPILGVGIELNPKIFRVGAMYGQINRAENSDTTQFYRQEPIYRRMGYSFKLGLGNDNNFVDFIYFKAWDLAGTLPEQIIDSTVVRPAENAIAGIVTRQKIGKHLSFQGEAAFSVYTDDIRSEEIEIGDKEKAWAHHFIVPRRSSRLLTAIKGGLEYRKASTSFTLNYERIDPEYVSMGAYYFNNDSESLLAGGSWKLFKKKLSIRAKMGLQRNNLLDLNNKTTLRKVGMGSVTFKPIKSIIIYGRYSNYSVNHQRLMDDLIDSTRLFRVNQSFTTRITYSIRKKNTNQRITLGGSIREVSDRNEFATTDVSSFITRGQLNYQLTFPKKQLSLSLGSNISKYRFSGRENLRYGMNAGVNQSLLKRKIRLGMNVPIYWVRNADGLDSRIVRLRLSANYKFNKAQQFMVRFNLLDNQDFSPRDKDFQETIGEITYRYSF